MQQFLRVGFVRSENLSFNDLGDGFIELEGVIECAGNIYIDVYKRIEILEGDGANALVQTVDYSYNAVVSGTGNILRYDSPTQTTTSNTTSIGSMSLRKKKPRSSSYRTKNIDQHWAK